jgi:type IV pilus assembly protein PilE
MRDKSMKKLAKGFTLIELMVTVAIVGVISAIAYPAYQGYIADTYVAQATSDLKACGMALERYYSNGFTYVGADTNTVCNTSSPTEGTPQYTITYESLTSTAYMIRATPIGGSCGSGDCIELNQTGDQTLN